MINDLLEATELNLSQSFELQKISRTNLELYTKEELLEFLLKTYKRNMQLENQSKFLVKRLMQYEF